MIAQMLVDKGADVNKGNEVCGHLIYIGSLIQS